MLKHLYFCFMNIDIRKLITTPELCKLLRISRQTVYKYRRKGLPTIYIGTQKPMHDIDQVNKWLEGQQDNFKSNTKTQ
jgi:hypothetical protein